MHQFFQFSICVCLVILAGGSIHYVHDHPTFAGGLLLIIIWGIMLKFINRTNVFVFDKNGKKPKSSDQDVSGKRITQLEKRLSDIQDIVIAIDEKMSRVETQSYSKVEENEKI
ncbi:MAG: hypothetical protein ACO36I_00405 [Candidatus Latescibacterota bacterium]|jgi:hypothetical protein